MLMMQLQNGVQASYAQCHYTPDDCRNYTIIGTEGRIENFGAYSTEDHWASVHLYNVRMGYQAEGNEIFRIPHVAGSHGGADPQMIEDFISYLRGGESNGANMWDARMSVAVGCMGTESLRNNSTPFEVN